MALVGINLLYLIPGVSGGTETYARGLLRGLARIDAEHTYRIYVNLESRDWPIPDDSRFQRVVCGVKAVSRGRRYLYEQSMFARLVRKEKVNVLHSLGYMCPFFCSVPSTVTIHDVNCAALGNFMSPTRRIVLYTMLRLSAAMCRRIVTISEFSKSEIIRYLKIDASKIAVIPLAGESHAAAACTGNEFNAAGPYLALFSSPFAHKNISRAIEAYESARLAGKIKQRLVVIGTLHSGLSLDGQPGIHTTGYVSRESMLNILAGADMLINPSLYEGFGLPILDAMELGTPVVCSKRASFPEVAGDAAEYFDPESIQDIAEKLVRVANDAEMRSQMRQKGFANAKRFSWQQTARLTERVYAGLVA